MERLQKIISASGICSRRKAENLITNGEVTVNGEVITELGTKVSGDDDIRINGKKLSSEPKVYYLLNKPRNVISSTSDKEGRKTVIDLINTKLKIYPIGRLDYDTTGLIILTNDGELSNILMHPSNKVEKTYLVKLNKILTMEDYFKIKKGIIIDNKKIIPKRLKIKRKDLERNVCYVQITVVEGLNHMIKNIFNSLGYDVLKLSRERYAFLTIEGLNSGYYRELSNGEVKELYQLKKLQK